MKSLNPIVTILVLILAIPFGMMVTSQYIDSIESESVQSVAPWTPTLEYAVNATVLLKTKFGHGSGVFVDSCGTIMTAKHVLTAQDGPMEAVLADGTTYTIRDKWVSEFADIGFCRIDPNTPVPYLFFSPFPAHLGDTVWTVGTPLFVGLAGTVTRGIISNTDRVIEDDSYYQTDAVAAPGCSGGPLLDSNLDIVGIITRCVVPGGGYNAAVPLDAVMNSYWAYLGRNDGI